MHERKGKGVLISIFFFLSMKASKLCISIACILFYLRWGNDFLDHFPYGALSKEEPTLETMVCLFACIVRECVGGTVSVAVYTIPLLP